jgi:putative ABC transport system substrate-binding protein
VWPIAARAQQGERVKRLGALMSGAETDPEMQARLAGFRQGLGNSLLKLPRTPANSTD